MNRIPTSKHVYRSSLAVITKKEKIKNIGDEITNKKIFWHWLDPSYLVPAHLAVTFTLDIRNGLDRPVDWYQYRLPKRFNRNGESLLFVPRPLVLGATEVGTTVLGYVVCFVLCLWKTFMSAAISLDILSLDHEHSNHFRIYNVTSKYFSLWRRVSVII